MTMFIFANNLSTTLAAAITNAATTITLSSAANIPTIPAGSYLPITLNNAATKTVYEIMYATAASGTSLTVIRAQEGTTAQSWAAGDFVFSTATAASTATSGGNAANKFQVAAAVGSSDATPLAQVQALVTAGTAGVSSFNSRTGNVTLTSGDVDSALGYTPANQATTLSNPMNAAGDLIVGGAGGTPTKLAVGASGDVLTVAGGAATWAPPTGGSTGTFIQAGAGAVTRTAQDKMRELVSVKDFGAVGDGVTDDTAAFSLAAQNAPANIIMQYENIVLNTPEPPVAVVYIPPGVYVVSSPVNVGNREIVWVYDSAAIIASYNDVNLGGRIFRPGEKTVSSRHFGTRDYACGFSVIANRPDLNASAGVMGLSSPAGLSTYSDRDSVGFYAENRDVGEVTLVAPNYTATTVTCPTHIDTNFLRVGMIIDTAHNPKYSGFITGWASDGSSITVDAWYIVNGTGNVGTPANGINAYVNAVTKVWAQNSNVFLTSGAFASQASGFELGLFNDKAQPSAAGQNPKVWGYDCPNLGTYKCESAYIARGLGAGFFHGFESQNCDVAFSNTSDGTVIQSFDSTGVQNFLIGADGSIVVGKSNTAANVGINFHSSGNAVSYDTALLSAGGGTSTGQGSLVVGGFELATPQCRPLGDGQYALGTPSFRWSTVYSATGTINTSDERMKRDIKPLSLDLATAMVESIDAKTFKWIDQAPEKTKKTIKRQKTVKRKVSKEFEEITIVDGKAISRMVTKTHEIDEPVFEEYPIVDKDGNPIYESVGKGITKKRVHRVPVMEEVEIEENKPPQKPSVRTHFGFIAQDFERAIKDAGLTTEDFAGLIIDKETGKYGLRYDQVLTILWPVVQDILRRVKSIEGS